jgi:hypothetical protein
MVSVPNPLPLPIHEPSMNPLTEAALHGRSMEDLLGEYLFVPCGPGQESLVMPSVSGCGRAAAAVK